MALLTAAKRLFIPQKTLPADKGFADAMRVIENFNPINKLVAGANVTLSPADGTGPQVTIAASGGGGGGGASNGEMSVFLGPDQSVPGMTNRTNWMGPGGAPGGPLSNGECVFLLSNADGANVPSGDGTSTYLSFGSGWHVNSAGLGANKSINLMPTITVPNFTGLNPIFIFLGLTAANATFSNFLSYSSNGNAFTTGQTYTFLTTDFTAIGASGADLSLQADGIESAAGGVYWAGISILVIIPQGTVFT